MSTSATDVFFAAPPIARTLAATVFALSITVYYSGLISFYYIPFIPSAFLMYTYCSKLETASPRFSRPGDFFTYIVFVCVTIMGLNAFIVGGSIFTSALILAFAWTACQDDRGQKAHFLVFTIPALWIPYAMLLMTLLMAGPQATIIEATGLVAAHLHDFLTRLWPTFGGGRNYITTPAFVRRMWQADGPVKRLYGTAFDPAQRNAASASASGSSGVLPESWRSRGSGHRLGGD
ncbi:hypothetical protein D0Z07_5590 [Hyphodiscus hymeniophilus]|uniref:Derlin n=1 Tax=Hyphodiscus hymeniophilus TaxID=353542 RepID=A0A9P7AWW5_9HELO|nr:hypothetical protein D0Z07_5590 [Hyphodiscus hymeniophilus]